MVDKGLDGDTSSFKAGLPTHAVWVDPYDLIELEFLLLSHMSRLAPNGGRRKYLTGRISTILARGDGGFGRVEHVQQIMAALQWLWGKP